MLTDMRVRNLKPTDKPYKTADGDGMYVLVTPSGSKLWRLDYRLNGKRLTLAMGAYPEVSLVEARRKREIARANIAAGLDPQPKAPTFKEIALRWLGKQEWVESYASRMRSRFNDDVFPQIGDMPIDTIRPAHVLTVIRSIEDRGSIEMGRRVYQMIGRVMRFAVGESLIPADPTRDLSESLAAPKPVQHRKFVPAEELPALMSRLSAIGSVTALATMFTIHTMARTSETRFATWDEMTEDRWSVPGHRMKMRRDHIVPLSPQALAILARVPRTSKWVFHIRGKPLSENAMLYGLYALGYHGKSTVHGMRTSASTYLNEHEWNSDWIEMQLAHVDGSVRGVYNAALYLRQRREMLRAWSNYLEPDDEELL